MELTSIDYARMIQYASLKMFQQHLNKTQIHKILFYVYGVYYAQTDKLLFTDDTPKVWPYGPVFPRVNKRIKVGENITLSESGAEVFGKNIEALHIIKDAVVMMHNKSALSLTEWSHRDDSPWYRTLNPVDDNGVPLAQCEWNTPIKPEYIKEYFSNPRNLNIDECF